MPSGIELILDPSPNVAPRESCVKVVLLRSASSCICLLVFCFAVGSVITGFNKSVSVLVLTGGIAISITLDGLNPPYVFIGSSGFSLPLFLYIRPPLRNVCADCGAGLFFIKAFQASSAAFL